VDQIRPFATTVSPTHKVFPCVLLQRTRACFFKELMRASSNNPERACYRPFRMIKTITRREGNYSRAKWLSWRRYFCERRRAEHLLAKSPGQPDAYQEYESRPERHSPHDGVLRDVLEPHHSPGALGSSAVLTRSSFSLYYLLFFPSHSPLLLYLAGWNQNEM